MLLKSDSQNAKLSPWLLCLGLGLAVIGCGREAGKDGDEETQSSKDRDDNDKDPGDDSGDSDGTDGTSDPSDSDGTDGTSDPDDDGTSPSQNGLIKYRAGDRLTPYFLNATDGATQFYGWFDEELKTPCSFQLLSSNTLVNGEDTKMHCLPPMFNVALGNFFADEDCDISVDVAIVDKCSNPEGIRYAKMASYSCREDGPEIREVLDFQKLTDQDKLWYWAGIGAPCGDPPIDLKNYVVLQLGDSMELGDFVGASPSK